LLAFLVIPLILLVLRVEPGSLWTTLRVVEVRQAIGVSLKTTVISLALILFFGTPLAYLLGRHTFRGRRFLDACIDLPIVLPPAVAGIALLIAFGRRGVLGQALEACGIQVAFTPLAVIMAQVFVASSFYIRAAALGFAAIPEELEEAARLDGATRWQTFLRVVLPLSHKAIISGGAMSWARALGEFGATIIFAGNLPGRTQTMPLAIYLGFEMNFQNALTLAVILIALSVLSLFAVRTLLSSGFRYSLPNVRWRPGAQGRVDGYRCNASRSRLRSS
jgi:molybdate transport system permease protein